nr:MAG: putative RNA-dependent RNA polymerase [Mitoviridae sp.]
MNKSWKSKSGKPAYKSHLRDRILGFLTTVIQILDWLGNFNSENSTQPVKELVSRIQRVVKTRGASEALDFVKKLRTAFQLYLSGTPEKVPGISLTKDGIPKVFGDLIRIIRVSDPAQRSRVARAIFTVLFCTRALNLGKEPDLGPITSQGRADPYLLELFKPYLVGFWSTLDGRDPKIKESRVIWKRFHMSSKAGPNGHALWTSLADLYCLPESLLEAIRVVGGSEVSSHIDTLLQLKNQLSLVLPVEGSRYRKITWFPDKEYKVRVIAILDYWSQTVLKPLHHWLFTCLRSIPQDCTFDQGSFWDKIKGSEVFYSVDLTAATDRFPIDLISLVLEAKLGQPYVKAWKTIMVGFPFESPKGSLRYSVGNPMGAYSSWSSFAVAHHFVVYSCIQDLNLSWSDVPYCLLGDDIVIGHEKVGELYLAKLKLLGVDVSPLKTHKSSTFLEFAKRMFYKGHEISPFPISGLKEVEKSSILLNSFFNECSLKGWVYPEGSPSLVDLYYSEVKRLPSRLRKKYLDNAILGDQMIKVIRGSLPASECISTLIRQFGLQDLQLSPEECESILSTCTINLFSRGLPRGDETRGYPLGKLAEDLVIFLTTEDPVESVSSLKMLAIYALPHLNVYGQIEEEYMGYHRRLRDVVPWSDFDHSEVFRTLALPMDDRVFVRRHSHLILNASHSLGKEVLKMLKQMSPFEYPFHMAGRGWDSRKPKLTA